MAHQKILEQILHKHAQGQKSLAILVDPDKAPDAYLKKLVQYAASGVIDYFFVGGSLLIASALNSTVHALTGQKNVPVILFPGNHTHIVPQADGILFLSLLSGRNPDFLIGQQVLAAPLLKDTSLEILPTAYLLIDSGKPTTVVYISNTQPIPADKPEIAAVTALAGKYMGMQLVFLDGGSGAKIPIAPDTIKTVANYVNAPLIVGGGIHSVDKIELAWQSGADIVVVGNALEHDFKILEVLAQKHSV